MRFDIGLQVVVYSNSNKAPPGIPLLPYQAKRVTSSPFIWQKEVTYREEKGRAKAGTQFPLPIPS